MDQICVLLAEFDGEAPSDKTPATSILNRNN
jgi:hypothetical protein